MSQGHKVTGSQVKKMQKPNTLGIRHVALNVPDVDACVKFYTDVLGMAVEWKPDPDNVYLTSGADNLAIHKSAANKKPDSLDHLGFIVKDIDDVDQWAEYVRTKGIKFFKNPKTHRDGARSFYIEDPAGNVVQIMYHPPISDKT